jgi:hypothetical protein
MLGLSRVENPGSPMQKLKAALQGKISFIVVLLDYYLVTQNVG